MISPITKIFSPGSYFGINFREVGSGYSQQRFLYVHSEHVLLLRSLYGSIKLRNTSSMCCYVICIYVMTEYIVHFVDQLQAYRPESIGIILFHRIQAADRECGAQRLSNAADGFFMLET